MKNSINFGSTFILWLIPIALLWSGCSNNNTSPQATEQDLNIAEDAEDLVEITKSDKLIEPPAVKKFGGEVIEEDTIGNISYAYIGIGEKDRAKYPVGLYKSIHLFVNEKDEGKVARYSFKTDGDNYAFVTSDEEHKEYLYYNNSEQTENLGEIYYSPIGGQGIWLKNGNLAYYKKVELKADSLPHLMLNNKNLGWLDSFDMDEDGNIAYIKGKKENRNSELYFNRSLKVKDVQNCNNDMCEWLIAEFQDEKLVLESGIHGEEGGEYLVSDLLKNIVLNQKNGG